MFSSRIVLSSIVYTIDSVSSVVLGGYKFRLVCGAWSACGVFVFWMLFTYMRLLKLYRSCVYTYVKS